MSCAMPLAICPSTRRRSCCSTTCCACVEFVVGLLQRAVQPGLAGGQRHVFGELSHELALPAVEAVALCTPGHQHAQDLALRLQGRKHGGSRCPHRASCSGPLKRRVGQCRLVQQFAARAAQQTAVRRAAAHRLHPARHARRHSVHQLRAQVRHGEGAGWPDRTARPPRTRSRSAIRCCRRPPGKMRSRSRRSSVARTMWLSSSVRESCSCSRASASDALGHVLHGAADRDHRTAGCRACGSSMFSSNQRSVTVGQEAAVGPASGRCRPRRQSFIVSASTRRGRPDGRA